MRSSSSTSDTARSSSDSFCNTNIRATVGRIPTVGQSLFTLFGRHNVSVYSLSSVFAPRGSTAPARPTVAPPGGNRSARSGSTGLLPGWYRSAPAEGHLCPRKRLCKPACGQPAHCVRGAKIRQDFANGLQSARAISEYFPLDNRLGNAAPPTESTDTRENLPLSHPKAAPAATGKRSILSP